MPDRISVEQRLELYSIPEPNSGCWLWSAHVDKNGYGILQVRRQARKAHRLSYDAFVGPIPDGMMVCHHCDMAGCINPDHLFLGTAQDNSDDMLAKGRYRHGGKPHPGERNGRAILTEKQAVEILLAKKSYGYFARAARLYGVTEGAIARLVHGQSWKHLPRDRSRLWGRWALLGGVRKTTPRRHAPGGVR